MKLCNTDKGNMKKVLATRTVTVQVQELSPFIISVHVIFEQSIP